MEHRELRSIAEEVCRRSSIYVSPRDIERLIGAVRSSRDQWTIVDLADFPVPAVFEAVRVLAEQGIVTVDGSVIRLSDGPGIAGDIPAVEDLSCGSCGGRGLDPKGLAGLGERFIEAQRRRPRPSHDLDQGYVTPESTLARFQLALERGDITGKDVLILGDDDLLSIVLGLSGLAASITVVEMDERLVGFIRDAGAREGFEVSVARLDLRKPLPAEHSRAYDTFFTDPPETVAAADAFVGRGISSLRSPGCAGYFGFTRREASLTKWYHLQEMLLGYGVVITDIVHNFNEYVNWGYEEETLAWRLAPLPVLPEGAWYRSAQYRIEALPGFTGSSKDYGAENIYEDSESSTT